MNIDKVCRKIANKNQMDLEEVKQIVLYQFYFTKQVIQDPDDTHDILFNKLFRFKLKSRFKENKQNKLSSK